MTEWQDISTAPRDGTAFLAWGCLHNDGDVDMGEKPFMTISWWRDCCFYSLESGGYEPTHWMPLPPPPEN